MMGDLAKSEGAVAQGAWTVSAARYVGTVIAALISGRLEKTRVHSLILIIRLYVLEN